MHNISPRHSAAAISKVLAVVLLAAMSCGLAWRAQADSPNAGERTAGRGRPEDALIGEWWTEGREGRVEFRKYRDGTFRGVTTCCRRLKPDANSPRTDMHNPNPKLRERSTIGIVIIWKLVFDDGEYTGGYVYNPRDGETYRMNVEVLDANTIKIRGFLGISLFGQSQVWKRATPAERLDHAPR